MLGALLDTSVQVLVQKKPSNNDGLTPHQPAKQVFSTMAHRTAPNFWMIVVNRLRNVPMYNYRTAV